MRQFIQEIRFLLRAGLLFFFRRHFARIEGIENLLPAFCRLGIGDAKGEVIHPELALLFFRAVTSLAVGVKQGPVFVPENGLGGAPGVRGGRGVRAC